MGTFNEKMTAIANGIRKATNDSALLTLDQMAYEVNRLVEPEAYWASIFNNTFEGNLVNHKVTGKLPGSFQSGNTKLTGVDLPHITSGDGSLFANCSNLTEVKLDGIGTFSGGTFESCTKLPKIYLPSLTTISGWGWAFNSCTNLEKVYFPKLTDFSGALSCFNSCGKLTTVILGASTVCSLSSSNVFPQTPIANGTGYIYVPSALVNSYKSATNWSNFAS